MSRGHPAGQRQGESRSIRPNSVKRKPQASPQDIRKVIEGHGLSVEQIKSLAEPAYAHGRSGYLKRVRKRREKEKRFDVQRNQMDEAPPHIFVQPRETPSNELAQIGSPEGSSTEEDDSSEPEADKPVEPEPVTLPRYDMYYDLTTLRNRLVKMQKSRSWWLLLVVAIWITALNREEVMSHFAQHANTVRYVSAGIIGMLVVLFWFSDRERPEYSDVTVASHYAQEVCRRESKHLVDRLVQGITHDIAGLPPVVYRIQPVAAFSVISMLAVLNPAGSQQAYQVAAIKARLEMHKEKDAEIKAYLIYEYARCLNLSLGRTATEKVYDISIVE